MIERQRLVLLNQAGALLFQVQRNSVNLFILLEPSHALTHGLVSALFRTLPSGAV